MITADDVRAIAEAIAKANQSPDPAGWAADVVEQFGVEPETAPAPAEPAAP